MKKIVTVFILLLFTINFPEPSINSKEGKAIFAFIAIKTQNATIPDKYVGVLQNVSITLYGNTTAVIFHLLLLFPTVFVTNETVILHMKLFVGALYREEEYGCIVGYAFMVKWKW